MCLFLSIPGRTEFAPEEDAHVIGDCIKVPFCNCYHVVRKIDVTEFQ